MAVEVRACSRADVAAAMTPISHYFGRTPSEERAERLVRVLEPSRLHAAWEDGRAVGGAGAYSFRLTVPGGRVPAAGVMGVGVLPTHRRRGILTAMMRAQLDDVHARGEPVAYLWSSEDVIYGRYGYGIASMSGEIDVPRTHAGFALPSEPAGRVRLVEHDEALERLPQVYDRVLPGLHGAFARSREWWETRRLASREGEPEQVRALLELDGEPAGYALYQMYSAIELGVASGFATVHEALAVSPRATRELWRFLLSIDWIASVRASLLPLDHPLFLLLAHPRRMRFRVRDGLWVRLVDVGAALSARSYAEDERVVFDVRDAFCPWNDGRWALEGGEAGRTGADADLALDVTALGSVYLGGFTFAQLVRAGRVEELREDAVAGADRLFRTDRAPWCPEIF